MSAQFFRTTAGMLSAPEAFLGFWLTRNGIKPMKNKIEAIQRIAIPKTPKELKSFLGMINFYRDMSRMIKFKVEAFKWH